jgi:hypothetical protein
MAWTLGEINNNNNVLTIVLFQAESLLKVGFEPPVLN